MTYCTKPLCPEPINKDTSVGICAGCGGNLLLNNHYRAVSLLGEGYSVNTFKAIDQHQPRQQTCIIKRFMVCHNDYLSFQQDDIDFFNNEAKQLQSLDHHPQIPKFLAYADEDDQRYFVQEFIDGQNLEQELEVKGKFDQFQIRELLGSLLLLLDYLHTQPIPVIHNNISPTNIIRRHSDSSLVLIDFGTSKIASQHFLALRCSRIARIDYTAPQQFRHITTATGDIFSLGVTCLHLLSGFRPRDLYNPIEDKWMWLDHLPDNFDDDNLVRVLHKMVLPNPYHRYQSVQEIIEDLSKGK
jgi:serine/threonine protein kinase